MNKIKYVSLADPLFLGGKNHGLKIFNGDKGMVIEYVEEKDHVKCHFNKETATIKHYVAIVESSAPEKKELVMPPRGAVKAQASSPTDHVFSSGPGKTHN